MPRYSISEWFDFGGGGDIFWTNDLEEAKRKIDFFCKDGTMFVHYSLYDNEQKRFISGP